MSSPTNIYGVIDAELERLHQQFKLVTELERNGQYQNYGAAILWGRIDMIHKILLDAFSTHDKAIQEKVAELALTDTRRNHE